MRTARILPPSPLLLLLLALLLPLLSVPARAQPTQYVDPFIGTGGEGYGVGSLNPGPQLPFGMARIGPDTADVGDIQPGFDHCGGYWYPDSTIRAFSHMHLVGAGLADLGLVGVMPSGAKPSAGVVSNYGFRSKFSHATETAGVGYYGVSLDDHKITVELTATLHGGVHRITYPAATRDSQYLYFYVSHSLTPNSCADAYIHIDSSSQTVSGYVHSMGSLSGRFGGVRAFFAARFNTSFEGLGVWENATVHENAASWNGTNIGGFVRFASSPAAGPSSVEMYIALSMISVEQAFRNLEAELPAQATTFESVRAAAVAAWTTILSKAAVVTADPAAVGDAATDDLTKFFTALYHAHLAPTNYSEPGGVYLGFDRAVHTLPAGQDAFYSDMSIWDTYRSQTPLLSLLDPERQLDIVRSLVLIMQQNQDLPRWPLANGETNCMIGTHANLMITDAYLKGITDFDVQAAYNEMKLQATTSRPVNGRSSVAQWLSLGYIPSDTAGSSVALTLEYCLDDWAVGTLAQLLNMTADAQVFLQRAHSNYKNLWNKDELLFIGKTSNGTWTFPKSKDLWDKLYTEGDAWQWRWYVPHDVEGLISLFPTRDKFASALNEFFELGSLDLSNVLPNPYAWYGNEPSMFTVWEFAYANRSDLTQKWSRWLLKHKFTTGPSGLSGNDDYGAFSSFIFWTMLGVYPVSGSEQYVLGSPTFADTIVYLNSAHTQFLRVTAYNGNSGANIYVSKVAVNGVAWTSPFVSHSMLVAPGGCRIEFWMQGSPSVSV